ncbi:MAG: STAS domain-containing protein [Acidimicrobiia bacterium]|nr:STAS domain-containing protein [Acidimicrobiia bacterium]
MTEFDVTVRRHGDAAIVDLVGQVNALARESLEAAAEEALGDGPRRIVLNFSDVGFINSTGIAMVVGLMGRARAAHIKVEAFGLTDHFREIFEITRLIDFMTIHDDEAAALGRGSYTSPKSSDGPRPQPE